MRNINSPRKIVKIINIFKGRAAIRFYNIFLVFDNNIFFDFDGRILKDISQRYITEHNLEPDLLKVVIFQSGR